MTRTPDEIKKGLKSCHSLGRVLKAEDWCKIKCPYMDMKYGCGQDYMHGDALAYIQQLEAERDALATALQRCDLDCDYCKHSAIPNPSCEAMNMDCMSCDADCPCKSCLDNSNWQWRGVQMEE